MLHPVVEARDLLQRGQRHLGGRRVGEPHVVQPHPEGPGGQRRRRRRLGEDGLQVQHLEDPLEADERAHDVDAGVRQRGQRGVQPGEQQRQGHDRAGVEGAGDREPAAEPVDQRLRERGDQRQAGEEDAVDHRRAHPDRADPVGPVAELVGLGLRAPEELDQRRAARGEALGHLPGHRGVEVGRLPLQRRDPPPHAPRRQDEDRQEDQREDRHLPRQRHHDDDGQDELDRVGRRGPRASR